SIVRNAGARGPQEEEGSIEQHRIGLDDGARQVRQQRHVVRRLAELTPVYSAVAVALDPHIRQEHVDVAQYAYIVDRGGVVVELICVADRAIAPDLNGDRVTRRPTGADRGAARNLKM